MPDENSNLKSPAPAGRSTPNRRRGRRGGRGRSQGPRPVGDKAPADNSPAPETDDSTDEITPPAESAEVGEQHEAEADNSGGFRVPHSDAPAEFASHATASEEAPEAESASEPAAEAASAPARAPRRDERREPRRDERPPAPPPRVSPAQRQWVKPADFRPAAASAISEAVEHATFIANALKDLHDQMDEILELVEVADRQKLTDERELEELRRALRRIQPQRPPSPPPPQYNQRGPRRDEPRRDESRRPAPERRAPEPRSETPLPGTAASPAESPEPPPAAK